MGYVVYSLGTNGTTQYAKLGDCHPWEYDSAFTQMVWFKTSDSSGYLISKMDNTPTGYGTYVGASGEIRIRLFSGALSQLEVRTHTTGWNDGKWHCLLWAYNGTGLAAGVTVWIDGAEQYLVTVSDTLGTNSLVNAAELNFAGRNNGSDLLACRFNEAAFYGAALTGTDASLIYNGGTPWDLKAVECGQHLVAWWRLDTAVNRMFPAIWDYAYLRYVGAATNMEFSDLSSDTPGGVSALSMTFDASKTQKVLWSSGELVWQRNNAFSFSLWVKTTTPAGLMYPIIMLSKAITTTTVFPAAGYSIAVEETGEVRVAFAQYYTNAVDVRGSTLINDGNWHHVVVSYDGSSAAAGVNLWVDGVLEVLTIIRGTVTSNWSTAGVLRLSGKTDDRHLFTGSLVEIVAFGQTLSGPDVAELHNLGVPPDIRTTAIGKKARCWWRGDQLPLRWEDHALYPRVPAKAGIGLGSGRIESELTPPDYAMGAKILFDTQAKYPGPGGYSKFSMRAGSNHGAALAGYVPVPSMLNTQFTAGAWFLIDETTNLGSITAIGTGYYLYINGWGIQVYYNQISFVIRAPSDARIAIRTTATFFDSSWHHVVCTSSGGGTAGSLKIYVDGVLQTVTTEMNVNGDWTSGYYALGYGMSGSSVSSSYNFRGLLTNIAWWEGIEMDATQVLETYNGGVPVDYRTLTTAAYLQQYHNLGNTVEAVREGTLSALPDRICFDSPGGVSKGSMQLQRTDSLTLGGYLNWNRGMQFGFSLWFKAVYDTEQYLLAKEDGTRAGYAIFLTNDGEVEWLLTSTASSRMSVRTVAKFTDSAWHNVVVGWGGVSSASDLDIWVDGVLQAVTVPIDALTSGITDNASLQFGSTQQTSLACSGCIAEVFAFSKKPNVTDVTELYNGGSPPDPSTLTATSDLLAYWSLGEGYTPGDWVDSDLTMVANDVADSTDLPTEKTWITIPQYVLGDGDATSTCVRRLILDMKNRLAVAGWTVIGSSNSLNYEYEGDTAGGSYGGDSTSPFDTWESVSDVIWKVSTSQGPSSWVVLRSPPSAAGQFWIVLWHYSSNAVFVNGWWGDSKPVLRDPPTELCPTWGDTQRYARFMNNERIYDDNGTLGCRLYMSYCPDDGSFFILRQTLTRSYWGSMTALVVLNEGRVPDGFMKSVMYHYTWQTTRDSQPYSKFKTYVSDMGDAPIVSPLVPSYSNVATDILPIRSDNLEYYTPYPAFPVYLQTAPYSQYSGAGTQPVFGPVPDMYLSLRSTPAGSTAPEKSPHSYVCVESLFWVPGSIEPVF